MNREGILSYVFHHRIGIKQCGAKLALSALILFTALLTVQRPARAQCYTFSGYASPSGAPATLAVRLTDVGEPALTRIGGAVIYDYSLAALDGNSVALSVGDNVYFSTTFTSFLVETVAQTDATGTYSSLSIELSGSALAAQLQLQGAPGNFVPNGLAPSLPPLGQFATAQLSVTEPAPGTITLTSVTSGCGSIGKSDFDGDGKADYSIWRPYNGDWFILPSSNLASPLGQQWGLSGDLPVSSDFDGDGKTDFAVWRPTDGTWYVIPSSNPSQAVIQQWGLTGDIPVPADYDGDGIADFAVWRPTDGTWYVIPSSNPSAAIVQQWGLSGDIPVPADYDGDGKIDFAVWRPTDGTWYIIPSSNPSAAIVQQWGLSGDIPITGDYDGDGKTDFAIWRPSSGEWYIILSSDPSLPLVVQWGLDGDTPVAADFDGDGKTDLAVWRPSNGSWYILPSTNPNIALVQQWGLPGDIPK